jgi:microcompartment protein CcmL/EutN
MSASVAPGLALGLAELPGFSVMALISDQVAKEAAVHVAGIETTGNENLMLRLRGGVAAVQVALAFVERRARDLGTTAVVRCLARPAAGLDPLLQFPNAENPLYGGRDQMVPTDYPAPMNPTTEAPQLALGIIETQGLTAILEATDVMLNAANVTLVGKEKIGAAYVTVVVKGDVAAVKAAIEAGAEAVGSLGRLVAAHVIARPHADLVALLPK